MNAAETLTDSWLARRADLLVAAGLLLLLAVLVVPVAPWLLDMLLILSLASGLVILMMTIYVAHPLKFAVFPTVLLLITLFRLSLNVATTRQILLNAYGGKVIGAFGSFVVGGNYAVGLVVFVILVAIQFLVVTKGAGRIAEVAARFTLDAMPGRQMAIDADLNAGLIDDREARRRREEINRQADFYGAMDGAGKFVRGDAVAGIVITLVNIIGGLAIGLTQKGMGIGEAARTYTLLTIGDGLVAQIPALVISTSAGIIITRSEGQGHLGREVIRQTLAEPRAPLVVAGLLLALGLVPGLPLLPFLILGTLVGMVGLLARREEGTRRRAEEEAQRRPSPEPQEKIEKLLEVDPLELEIGFGLVPLVDEEKGGDLARRVGLIRRQLASESGLVVPPIRIRDNVRLPGDTYVINMRGVEMARGQLALGHDLAMGGPADGPALEGIPTKEPAFGLQAVWIPSAKREEAEMHGYTVVEPAAVLTTHLTELIRRQGHELLDRQETQRLLDQVKARHPAVVEELTPGLLPLGQVQKVLQRLLEERVSIRDLVTILETLADTAQSTKDLDVLVEKVREALGRALIQPYKDDRGVLHAIALDPELEQELLENIREGDGTRFLILPPDRLQALVAELTQAMEEAVVSSGQPLLLCSQAIRPY
ncbi:MAG: flagellar biosynthesis protein FlhA, partial [Candidatus Eisenbacteria bacterium]|nr:flagellar biosynthesis protein FlhA [Candidatus Eisenbacteria bacterium]